MRDTLRLNMASKSQIKNIFSLEQLFVVLMWVKAIDGFIETVAGFLLLFSTSATILSIAHVVTQEELAEDPDNFIANFILRAGQKLGDVQLFGSMYLISHGVVKVVLVSYLLRKDLRVYPWAIGFLTLFMLYQIYATIHHFSFIYLALSLLDVFIIYMAWQEYMHLTTKAS